MEEGSAEALDEIERRIPENAKHMRAILQDEWSLSVPPQCDEFLARCIRQKDGNVENAIKLVHAFHDAITNLRNWDAKLLPSLAREAYKTRVSLPLKVRDRDGRIIYVLRPGLWDPEEYHFEQASAFIWMVLQYISAQVKDAQQHGFVMVWDFSGITLKVVLAIKQWKLLQLGKMTQNGVVGRMKSLHVINHPKIVGLIYKGFKPFLKEKFKKRITLHDNVDSLLNAMGPEYLPTFLGGTQDPAECDDMVIVNGYFNSDQYFQDMINTGFPSK